MKNSNGTIGNKTRDLPNNAINVVVSFRRHGSLFWCNCVLLVEHNIGILFYLTTTEHLFLSY